MNPITMHATDTHPRNLARVILGIFALATLFAILAMATGCRSSIPDVAGSRLTYKRTTPDGIKIEVDLHSPREVRIQGASIDPINGLLVLTNYSAVPNEAALRARVDEAAQQREMAREYLNLGKEIGAMGVMAWTGRDVRQQPGGAAAGPLPPETVAQIVAALRAATNSAATNSIPQ